MTNSDRIYSYITSKLGAMFHEYREKKGLSMRDIYSDERISMAVVTDFENGVKCPKMKTIIQLLCAVDMPLQELFNEQIVSPYIKDCATQSEQNSPIRELLMSEGFNRSQIDNILDYVEFVRTKKK